METLFLNQQDVRDLLEMKSAISSVEFAFSEYARGKALMPHKVYLTLDKTYNGDFRAMPSYLSGSAGIKWVSTHQDNPSKKGLPAVQAVYILSDPSTGETLALMDATYLTAVRTGAAAAVASKFLAKKSPKNIGFIGCGVQANFSLSAHRIIYSNMNVLCADIIESNAKRFADEVGGRVVSLQEASQCDIVCTTTPSRNFIVKNEWVNPGTHINAIGADAPGKQELDPEILIRGRVFVDDEGQARESGEINVAWQTEKINSFHIAGSLGEVIIGESGGRISEKEITIFDSTGLAIQDAAMARLVYDAAKQRGIGQKLKIS